jgi:trehalose 6-phosphate phosphatase
VTLAARLAGEPGVWIEDKRLTLTVHYRQAPEAARARRAILRAAAQLAGVRVFGGKRVVNLVPRDAPDKARTLDRLRTRAGRATAIYVGDDENDEVAFAWARALGGLGIRVGSARASRATHFLRTQWHVDELLRQMVRAVRQGGAAPRHGR